MKIAAGYTKGLLASCLLLATGPAFAAELSDLKVEDVNGAAFSEDATLDDGASPIVLKAQILLDRSGASPGVIDGYMGENVEKAISTFETLHDLPQDGKLDPEVWSALTDKESAGPVLGKYEITQEDADYDFAEEIPSDYAERAKMKRSPYTSMAEMLAERFHMDIDLLKALNPGASFEKGSTITVAQAKREAPSGEVVRIKADKQTGKLLGYDAQDKLLVAYPATIGSKETPSPSGTHEVKAIAEDPVYYYNPSENFQQGDNDEPLEIPPGPNNPVGSVWIDLSEPTYGIHGTPAPAAIDKTNSHGCVRLTNWDAEELAHLVKVGATVEFVQ